jgi:lysophospholipase L1-like esterase
MRSSRKLPIRDLAALFNGISSLDPAVPTTFAGRRTSPAAVLVGVYASIAFLPIVIAQGALIRWRLPALPAARPPHQGLVPGEEPSIRILAIGESTIAGVGLRHGNETVAARTAHFLSAKTHRAVVWRAVGLSGATASDGLRRLLPRIGHEPADLVIIAFSVNDVINYRSPAAFADDMAALITATRMRVGDAAVVIAGIAPIFSFPALPWPLRTILGWRSAALQLAANRLERDLPRVVVERFAAPMAPDLFAEDGFHPNVQAHELWGEEIAALALPLLEPELSSKHRRRRALAPH